MAITANTGSNNWNTNGAWVGGVQPTAADDVVIPASAVVTIPTATTAVGRSCTVQASGTLAFASTTAVLTLGDGTAGAGNVALSVDASATITLTGIGTINFISTSATQQTITTGGKTMPSINVNGAGSSYLLSDALSMGTGGLTLTQGTLNTNNQTCTLGIFTSLGTLTRTLTMGSSAINLTNAGQSWNTSTSTNLTITANTATITQSGGTTTINTGSLTTMNGASLVLSGSGIATFTGSATWANLTRTGTATKTDGFQVVSAFSVTGTLTVTGNSATNRMNMFRFTIGTANVIGTSNPPVLTNVDFTDISATGAGGTWTGTSLGDCGGNSGITFDSPTTQTHTASAGGNWSDVTKWTSRVPLPQDDVVVDVNTTGTLTADMPRMGRDVTLTGFAGQLNLSIGVAVFGSFTCSTAMTWGATASTLSPSGRGSHTITSAGKTYPGAVTFQGPSGTYTLQDALTTTAALTVNDGTFTTNSFTVTCSTFAANSGRTTVVGLGTSTVSLTATTASTVFAVNAALTTLNASSSNIVLATASTNTRTIVSNGTAPKTFGTITYTVANSPGALAFTNPSTVTNLNVALGRILTMPASTTTTIASSGTFNVNGVVNGYQYQPGVAAHYISTPDSATLSITGDIDMRCRVALDDWTPTGVQILMAKRLAAGNQRSFYFRVDAAGHLRLALSADGITETTQNSSTTPVVANGDILWVRATWRASDGRTQYFTAPGSLTNPTAGDFIQLGADVIIAVASIFDSTAALEVGSTDNGVAVSFIPAVGKFYRAQLRNGIDGTLVYDADFTSKPVGANTFTESSSNAATVTINGTLAQAGDGRVSIVSSTGASAATLSKSSGYVQSNYLSIQDSTATGGAGWYAGGKSVSVSNNTGWIFSDPVFPDAIAATTTFYSPTITVGAVTVTPNAIAATTTFYNPTITPGTVTVTPDAIAAITAIYAPTISSSITVAPNALAATTTLYAPVISATYSLTPNLISSTTQIYVPLIVAGAVTVYPNAITANTVIYAPIVGGQPMVPYRLLHHSRVRRGPRGVLRGPRSY